MYANCACSSFFFLSSLVKRTCRTKMIAPSASASESSVELDETAGSLRASCPVCACGNTIAKEKITAKTTAKKAMVLSPVFMLYVYLFTQRYNSSGRLLKKITRNDRFITQPDTKIPVLRKKATRSGDFSPQRPLTGTPWSELNWTLLSPVHSTKCAMFKLYFLYQ